MKLYDIPLEWAALLARIEEADGEVTAADATEMEALMGATVDKLTAAGMAKRNLELKAEMAMAQAKVLEAEASRIKGNAKGLESAADHIGQMMLPGLQITGKLKTPAGTYYVTTRNAWSFELKPGTEFWELDTSLWRQPAPELNKTPLKKLAEAGELPEGIAANKSETVSVCLKSAKGE